MRLSSADGQRNLAHGGERAGPAAWLVSAWKQWQAKRDAHETRPAEAAIPPFTVPRITPEQVRMLFRGATVPEILGILGGPERAQLLRPFPDVGDRIDLWFRTLSKRHALMKRSIWGSLKMIKAISGQEITPTLSLAIRKAA